MSDEEFNKRYFEWMQNIVSVSNNYKTLLTALHSTPFHYILDRDYNRECDGVDLRYRFAYDSGIDERVVAATIDIYDCSILEMMVALTIRMESIMDDPAIGNRYYVWFWSMIKSLGLDGMTNDNFNQAYFDAVINRFISRTYFPNGIGGLFTVNSHPNDDLRSIEIWYQAMWYLNEKGD